MVRRRRYLRLASTVTAAGLLAGCSGDGDDAGGGDGGGDGGGGDGNGDGDGTGADTGGGTTGDGPSAQSEYPNYNWDLLDDASPTAATTVDMGDFAFAPLVARVPAGEAITFPNNDSVVHTVTAPALGIDEEVTGGTQTTITFDEPGTYDYVCRFHAPDMLGRLVVGEDASVDGGGTATGESGSSDDGGTATSGGGAGGGGDGGGGRGPY